MKSFLLPTIIILTLFSCNRDRYYRTKTGLLYQIQHTDTTQALATMGTTVKVNYTQQVKDSIISTTQDRMPLYYMVMPHMSNYNPLEVFDYGMHQGDSIIVKQRVDSMLAKKIFQKKPEWMADDDEWVTHLKVEKVFQNDSLLQVDKQMESEFVVAIQTELGMARIKRHLNKNSIDVKAHEKMYSQANESVNMGVFVFISCVVFLSLS
jgi:hypothetical protein